MRDKEDLDGLTTHLIDLGVIPKDSRILASGDFEELESVLTEAPCG